LLDPQFKQEPPWFAPVLVLDKAAAGAAFQAAAVLVQHLEQLVDGAERGEARLVLRGASSRHASAGERGPQLAKLRHLGHI
jgi:hypothetical protein